MLLGIRGQAKLIRIISLLRLNNPFVDLGLRLLGAKSILDGPLLYVATEIDLLWLTLQDGPALWPYWPSLE